VTNLPGYGPEPAIVQEVFQSSKTGRTREWLCTPYRISSKKRKPKRDRGQATTQTASLIAASFRTWRGSWPSVARSPAGMACLFSENKPSRGNSAPHKADFGTRAPL